MGGVGKHRQDSTVLLLFTVLAGVTKDAHGFSHCKTKTRPAERVFKANQT